MRTLLAILCLTLCYVVIHQKLNPPKKISADELAAKADMTDPNLPYKRLVVTQQAERWRQAIEHAKTAVVRINRANGGGGSGFIIHESGLIVTNCHVICTPEEGVTAVMENGDELPLTFVAGTGEEVGESDVAFAVITPPAPDSSQTYPALRLGDSDLLQVTQTVVAIGHPGHISLSVSAGIVSGFGYSETSIHGDIQYGALISGGSSGGPLLAHEASELKVAGMTTYMFKGKGNLPWSFAVPAKTIQFFFDQLQWTPQGAQSCEIGWSDIGVRPSPLAQHKMEWRRKSAAMRAGLPLHSSIVGVNGNAVQGYRDFYRRVSLHPKGSLLRLDVVKDDEELRVMVQPDWRASPVHYTAPGVSCS